MTGGIYFGKDGENININKLKSGIKAEDLGISDNDLILKSIFDQIDGLKKKDGSLDRSELQKFIEQVEALAQKDKKYSQLSAGF